MGLALGMGKVEDGEWIEGKKNKKWHIGQLKCLQRQQCQKADIRLRYIMKSKTTMSIPGKTTEAAFQIAIILTPVEVITKE